MKEYVERDKILDQAYYHLLFRKSVNDPYGVDAVDEDDIKAIPAADVVEVVRCQDCHWAHPILGESDITCDIDCLSHYNDDYCSYGQHKDGGVSDGKA